MKPLPPLQPEAFLPWLWNRYRHGDPVPTVAEYAICVALTPARCRRYLIGIAAKTRYMYRLDNRAERQACEQTP